MRFTGKVVLIIGGNSGIGRATARAFAAEGGHVTITGRDPKTLHEAQEEMGHGVRAIVSDISDLSALDALMADIKVRDGRIDVLFVNAGIGAFIPVRQVTEREWDQVHSINLKGVFFAVQKALPLMGRGGAIVLTGSIGAVSGIPGNSLYASAKAGLRALGRNFAAELVEEGIRVNVVSPGPVETPIIRRNLGLPPESEHELRRRMTEVSPMKRMGRPEEVAGAVLYLASEEASFVTGIDMLIDGGLASF